MAKKPEGSEVRLHSAAASPVEGHFRTLPEAPMVDAFLAMSSNRVLNRQVRDFIRNGEEGSALVSTAKRRRSRRRDDRRRSERDRDRDRARGGRDRRRRDDSR